MSTKKLVRDIKNKKLAGVCAGVANYFGLDVTLVRIIWLVLALMGSLGVWAYLILLLVLPKAE
ncbi:MAG: PspC domain-containing protein [Bacteroidales bacterium]|jgi:phage shock protein PspC (stress-responsive transcriptional regulator)|nr:PspC domain-containing protein [Bacteroidales bacterium]MBO5978823.1 PspC domain-containing protein [Bacteroidales bacterium]MBR0320956.1 PspC domain-containing protein [Bacteroidales bacterium]MBR1955980.1 PspC domain-containing protein [Bacteroidales bacterium]MBR5809847.1 PspC domain-containing protein [Bacteroidales bacterium]